MKMDNKLQLLAVLRRDRDAADLERLLLRSNWSLSRASSTSEALPVLRAGAAGVVICDAEAHGPWLDLANAARELPHPPLVLVASRLADDALWSDVLTHGAYDLVALPFRERELFSTLAHAWRHWHSNAGRKELQLA